MRDLLRSMAKAGFGSAANLAISLAKNKVLSMSLGPQGMGTLSLLQQIVSTAAPIATLGGDAPLVQGLASREGAERAVFFSSALSALLVSWSLCAAGLVLFAPLLAPSLLTEDIPGNHVLLIALLCLPLLGSAVSSLLNGTLAALGAVGSLQKAQMTGNLAGLVAAIPLGAIWMANQTEWLTAYIAIPPFFCILGSMYFLKKLPSADELRHKLSRKTISRECVNSFLKFGGVTIITGFTTALTWLLIRRAVAHNYGIEWLGYFSATYSLSGLALAVLGTALNSFYLPKFASSSISERPKLLKGVLSIVGPVAAGGLLIMQAFPELIVKALFNEKFLPMVPLLRWWAIGDFFRALSYVFAIPMFAGAHLRFLLVSEIAFTLIMGTLYFAASTAGAEFHQLGMLHCLVYVTYLACMLLFALRKGYV
jgi:O-antigen/teichoic acid export membrane protein